MDAKTAKENTGAAQSLPTQNGSKPSGQEIANRFNRKYVKARIVENTHPSGRKSYTIQQRHFLFRWWWVPAWVNSSAGAACGDTWNTLEEAKENLCWFDGTKMKQRVIG